MATKCLVCGFFAIFAPTHLEKDILHQKHTTLLDVNDFRYSLYRSRFTLSREEAAQLRYLLFNIYARHCFGQCQRQTGQTAFPRPC